jgi:hypothetical protein
MKRVIADEIAKMEPPPDPGQVGLEPAVPWEEIASGRFQPRRIRGSCRGRALG